MLFLDRDGFAGSRVPANAGIAPLDREGTESAQLDALAARHGVNNFIEYRRHNTVYITLDEMRIFLGYLLDEFGSDHVTPNNARQHS